MRLAEPKHHNTENQNEDGHYEEWSCLSERARGVVGSYHHQVPGDVSGERTSAREKLDDINRPDGDVIATVPFNETQRWNIPVYRVAIRERPADPLGALRLPDHCRR